MSETIELPPEQEEFLSKIPANYASGFGVVYNEQVTRIIFSENNRVSAAVMMDSKIAIQLADGIRNALRLHEQKKSPQPDAGKDKKPGGVNPFPVSR